MAGKRVEHWDWCQDYEVIGNGVPIPMGRAIARAVKEAIR